MRHLHFVHNNHWVVQECTIEIIYNIQYMARIVQWYFQCQLTNPRVEIRNWFVKVSERVKLFLWCAVCESCMTAFFFSFWDIEISWDCGCICLVWLLYLLQMCQTLNVEFHYYLSDTPIIMFPSHVRKLLFISHAHTRVHTHNTHVRDILPGISTL